MPTDTRIARQERAPSATAVARALAAPLDEREVSPDPTARRGLWETVVHRRGMVVFWVVVALGLGAIYQQFAPRRYESRAAFTAPRAVASADAGNVTAAGQGVSSPGPASPEVLAGALDDPNLQHALFLFDAPDPVRLLQRGLTVQSAPPGGTMSVSFVAEHPHVSEAVVDAVVAAYLREQGLIVRHPDGMDQGSTPAWMVDGPIDASRLVTMSERVGEAKAAAGQARSRLQRAAQAGRDVALLGTLLNDAGVQVAPPAADELAEMHGELDRLDDQLASMPASWGPQHRLRAPVAEERAALAAAYDQAEQGFILEAIAQFEGMSEEADAVLAQRQGELEQLQTVLAQSGVALPTVVDLPEVSTARTTPRAVVSFGVAGVLGLVMGVLFAWRDERLQPATTPGPEQGAEDWATDSYPAPSFQPPTVMKQADDLDRLLSAVDAPLLGIVPNHRGGETPNAGASASTASSIHQVRAVLQAQANKQGTHAYAFTSPQRGAGKTSVAIGVGSSLAVSGSRTLVVDCDLAGRIARGQTGQPVRPTRPAAPPASGGVSLDEFAEGEGTAEPPAGLPAVAPAPQQVGIVGMLQGGTLKQCAVKAKVPGLWLLPASGAVDYHIELMSDAFIRRVLDEARDQFDLVLFDTGPIPGSVEALLVGSQVDGVVVVVPRGESGQMLEKTLSYLKVVSATVLGTVFNHADRDPETQPAPPPEHDPAGVSDDIGQDIDDALDSVPLGSGILAAAVFADESAGLGGKSWDRAVKPKPARAEGGAPPEPAAAPNPAPPSADPAFEDDPVRAILPPE